MRKTYSSEPLERVAYFGHDGDCPADVYLRSNIEQRTVDDDLGESRIEYSADEVHVTTDLPEGDVEESFASLWAAGEAIEKGLEERVAELEAANVDLQLALCDVYESSIGGE